MFFRRYLAGSGIERAHMMKLPIVELFRRLSCAARVAALAQDGEITLLNTGLKVGCRCWLGFGPSIEPLSLVQCRNEYMTRQC